MNRRGIDPLGVAEGIAWLAAIVLVAVWLNGGL